MDFLAAVIQPTGLWYNIITFIGNLVHSHALTLILITLMIKILLYPFDILNKYTTKKNSRKQAELAPEIEKVKKRYASNPQLQNQKTMELYKANNYNLVGTCVGMLVYMVLTLVIFITLLNSLNTISSYKIYEEYQTLKTEYTAVYERTTGDENLKVSTAQNAVVAKYDDIKESFLWIKNIWRPDTSASSVLTYDDFVTNVKRVGVEASEVDKTEYTLVMNGLITSDVYKSCNGYYILAILAVLSTFGSTYLTTLVTKFKLKKQGREMVKSPDQNKVLTLILPILMGVFTLLYNAAFGIYIVTGALFGLLTSPITGLIVEAIESKVIKKEQAKITVSYDRNRRD